MSNLENEFVPLPMVNEVSDRISIENLNLPVGFDDERLGVDITRISKFATWAGLGEVSILGYSGRASEIIIGASANGTDTAVASHATTLERDLASGEVAKGKEFPPTLIKINTNEVA